MKTITFEFNCFTSAVIDIDEVRVAENGSDVGATITFNGKRLPAFRGELHDSKIDRGLAQDPSGKNADLLDELHLICLEKFDLIEGEVVVDLKAIESANPEGFHAAFDAYYLLLERLQDAIDAELENTHLIQVSQSEYVSEMVNARKYFGSVDWALYLDLLDGEIRLRHSSELSARPAGSKSCWVLLAMLDGMAIACPEDCDDAELEDLLRADPLSEMVDAAIGSDHYQGKRVRAEIND